MIQPPAVTTLPRHNTANTYLEHLRWKGWRGHSKGCAHNALSHDPKVHTRQHASAVEKCAGRVRLSDTERYTFSASRMCLVVVRKRGGFSSFFLFGAFLKPPTVSCALSHPSSTIF